MANEEIITRLAGTLTGWGCWDEGWKVPTWGGITQTWQRLGHEALRHLFAGVAVPVADESGLAPHARPHIVCDL